MAPITFDPLGPWEWSPYAPVVARLRALGLLDAIIKIKARWSFVADQELDAALKAFERARPGSQDEQDAIAAIRALETPHAPMAAQPPPARGSSAHEPPQGQEAPVRKRPEKATAARQAKVAERRLKFHQFMNGRDPATKRIGEIAAALNVSKATAARDRKALLNEMRDEMSKKAAGSRKPKQSLKK